MPHIQPIELSYLSFANPRHSRASGKRLWNVTVHGPREGDRQIFPGATLDNLLTGRCTSREFAGKMSQSPARERLRLGTLQHVRLFE